MPPPSVTTATLCVVCCVIAAAAASNATAPSFLECLSSVRGRSSRASLLASDDAQREEILGKVVGCAKVPVVHSLRAVREASAAGEIPLWDGAVVLHRLHDDGDVTPPEAVKTARAMDDDDLVGVHDLIVELDRVSRSYAMDVEVYPGVKASLQRDAKSEDAVNLNFKLDTGSLWEQEEEQEEGRDIMDDLDIVEDRHGHKKKKVLKGLKKLKKKLAPYLPLLAIPLAIQLMMLPLYIMALKMMALKSILLGKMTLMLVAFNILRNVQQRQHEDDHNSRVAAEYYGYQDDGVEYGGWVNRRRGFSGRSASDTQQRTQHIRRRR